MNHTSDRTVKLFVTVKNRAVIFPKNLDLNGLSKDEFHAELILSEQNFVDKEVFNTLAAETEVDLLPAGTRLLINIALKELLSNEKLRNRIITDEKPRPNANGGFVEASLVKNLKLRLRGSKKAQLIDTPVYIPALDETAKSVNHAYTRVSEEFEPWRLSNTANVFSKVYWLDAEANAWRPLDARRRQAESGMLTPLTN